MLEDEIENAQRLVKTDAARRASIVAQVSIRAFV
jgi:hypothetical protein